MKIGIVCPHIFMQDKILPDVIFSPGLLAIDLADGLVDLKHEVTLYSPSIVKTDAKNITEDLSGFENELSQRSYGYSELLKRNPLLFVTLARQVQTKLIAKAITDANNGELDILHFYMNEEELGLVMSDFCKAPTVFTHHDPYNFLARYRSIFPQYKNKNFISISIAQRSAMPPDTNWVGNVCHGIQTDLFKPHFAAPNNPNHEPSEKYIAYLGRIVEPKGVHLAIAAAQKAGVKLKIAGKYYGDSEKNKYWSEIIKPEIDNDLIEYVGFISGVEAKQEFLQNGKALIIPSTFQEPFGMVMIEALACGTPVIGLDNGAIPEVIQDDVNGFLIQDSARSERTRYENDSGLRDKRFYEPNEKIINDLANAIKNIDNIDRKKCRLSFEEKFTLDEMVRGHEEIYMQQAK